RVREVCGGWDRSGRLEHRDAAARGGRERYGVQNRGGDRQAGTGRSAGADPIAGQEDAALDRSEAAGVFDSVYVSWRRCDTGDKALELESGELCLWIAIV